MAAAWVVVRAGVDGAVWNDGGVGVVGVAPWGWAGARVALTLFIVQLALNGLWRWLFFAWHLGAWAFAEIVVLWLVLAATIGAFAKRQVLAG